MLVTNFDVESARVVRRRCVAADDDDGGDARRAVEVVESTIRYVRRSRDGEWRGWIDRDDDGDDGLGCDRSLRRWWCASRARLK